MTRGEWRLYREWFERTALADLLGADFGLAEIHKLYRCHDRLLEHKQALFDHLTSRWRDLLKAQHPAIKWMGVRDIGNVLRHQYASVSPSLTWNVVRDELPKLRAMIEAMRK